MTETEAKMLYETRPKIHLDDPDFGLMLGCACRYGLGRMSYIVKCITDYIEPLVPWMDTHALRIIERDITAHAETHDLGMSCDAELWLELRATIIHELERRGVKGGWS